MKNKTATISGLILLLLLVSFLSLLFGGTNISLSNIISVLNGKTTDTLLQTIIYQVRLPRIILCIVVGAGLAATGCVFQGILRNPLADPYTLGISGGASLGVTILIATGLANYGALYLPLSAFLGSLLTVFLIYIIASKKRFSVPILILGGVVLSFLFSSIVLFIFALSQSTDIHRTILWLMGDLSSADTNLIKIVSILVLFGIGLLLLFSRDLNILTLGEEKASHLGVNVEKSKKIFFVFSSLIVGACVSVSGIIGFVGLIIPHLSRKIVGPDHQVLIPVSALSGAIFLTICDTFARTIIKPVELPVGVITGIVGGLFFLIVLIRAKKWEIF
ncbi:MAG: iron ABC transporter permease [Elusimicrobia bacterium]|nr:iron ABC transporter permease [Elusimicrobiota bacterium]